MGDDRPNVYLEGDLVVYRASSLGHCTRALMAARRHYSPVPYPDWMYDRFEEGNVAEPIIMARFQEDNPDWTLHTDEAQDEITLKITDNVIVRGHIDGLATRNVTKCVVEAKALGPDWFNKFKRNGFDGLPDAYAWQVSIYMHALNAQKAVLVAGQKIEGKITPQSEFHYLWVDQPPFTLKQITERVMSVENNVDAADWPDCLNEFLCQYPYLHDEPEITELEGDTAAQVNKWAEIWAEAAQHESIAKKLKAQVKEEMSLWDATDKKYSTGTWKLTLVEEDVAEKTVTRKAYKKKYPRFTKVE
jgi:hypothetical protein